MHQLTIVLAYTAAALHGVAYLLYSIQTKLGKSSPKSASWGLWAFLSALNAFTFNGMNGELLVGVQFFTGAVACIIVFFYMLAIGKLSLPKPKEWMLFGIGLLGVFVWWNLRNAAGANMIIFTALAISFIPTYEALWKDPTKETPRSWIIWTAAFLVTTVNVIVNWEGQPLSLVMPIGGAILHGMVAVLSRKSRKEQFVTA